MTRGKERFNLSAINSNSAVSHKEQLNENKEQQKRDKGKRKEIPHDKRNLCN